jgi:hypothetical protein
MARSGAEQSNPAAVQAPVAFSTYVGGIATLVAGLTAIVTGLIKAFGLPSHPTAAQAAAIDGAFFLSAVALIGFAWVITADFRSRAITQSAHLTGSAAHAQAPAAHAAQPAAAQPAAAQPAAAQPAAAQPAAVGGQQASTSALFRVKVIESGDPYKVLSVVKDGNGEGDDLFLINRESGDKQFQWIPRSTVEFVSG